MSVDATAAEISDDIDRDNDATWILWCGDGDELSPRLDRADDTVHIEGIPIVKAVLYCCDLPVVGF